MSPYDPNCRTCRRIDMTSTCLVESLMGVAVGHWADSLTKTVVVILLLQPIIYTARWMTNRIQPMTHHYFGKELDSD